MKSALKIIKIIMKNIEEMRQQKEESTENLIFTVIITLFS